MPTTDYAYMLKPYVPETALEEIVALLNRHTPVLSLSARRHSKQGDYRWCAERGHLISVNRSLNPYAFLITLVHEVAHMQVYARYRHRVRPHGPAWKKCFRKLMLPLLCDRVFPPVILQPLAAHLKNPPASISSDLALNKALLQFNEAQDQRQFVEALPRDALFRTHAGRVFKRGERLRKRYRCVEVHTGRIYSFNPVACVEPLDKCLD